MTAPAGAAAEVRNLQVNPDAIRDNVQARRKTPA